MAERLREYLSSWAVDYNFLLLLFMYAVKIVALFNFRAKKRRWWAYPLHTAALFVSLFLIALAYSVILGTPTGMLFVNVALCMILYAVIVKTHGRTASIVLIAICFSTDMCFTVLNGSILGAMTQLGWNTTWEGAIRAVMTSLTLFIPFLINLRNVDHLVQTDNFERRYLPIILIYNFLTMIVSLGGNLLQISADKWSANALFLIVIYTGFIISNLVAYSLIGRIAAAQKTNAELEASKIRLESRVSLVQINQKNLEELRKMRHDFKNHISYMAALAEKEQYGDLKKYLSEYEGNMLRKTDSVDCGNQVIDAILHFEQAKAEECGLKILTKILVPPELPFRETDLCSILTNVLDNAIEGTVRCAQHDPIELSVTLKQDSFLYISIINSVGKANREALLSGKTSKSDSAVHGYGTKIVKSLVRQYNGEMIQNVLDGKFIVDIMLDTLYKENLT